MWVDCFYGGGDGRSWPSGSDWPGRRGCNQGDRVGLTLDLDKGTMSVSRNGELLGVMQSGLRGQFRWAVSFTNGGECVSIRRGQPA